ncbi:MAG: type 4a pilus biogenesis protein PilO [Candidatus Pacebacteria bacterium]|jgi:Tfp pilus assembly protein PilO|nr:type 4a pilus biogenesis protein PilO [Candidatus Paceibacterota bacterium]MBT3511924.1 type 4a pilus biogenesis protein PilO [Candidatus Paceibacterota bacterium]MBT4005246.1 type 4a pilus biogenesis protein PilO [Candidatus Paceibacterota bacterium]MBT4358966.1 type 4a pilus biogenesis protein PilO [Candidatus Paceibacterota bacterium]MBT4680469.1 type 4a pilus biogenesis protein PilO [Candidatus Paceibacterota bacterium]
MINNKSEINFKSLFTNRRYLLLSILSAVLSLIIVFSGITTQVNKLFDLNREISVEQDQVNVLRQKTNDLENIEAREAYDSLDLVNLILPSKKPLLELMTSLNVVAGRNDVVFVDLSLSPGKIASESAEFLGVAKSSSKNKKAQPKVSNEGYDSLVVEAEILGEFRNVQSFFEDIERVSPLTTITSLSLDIKSNDNIIRPSDEVQAEVVLKTYFFTQSVTSKLSSSLPDIGIKEQEIIEEISNYSFPAFNVQENIQGGGLDDLFGLNLQDLDEDQLTQ